MKLRAGEWDGAQPRGHVLKTLRKHGVSIEPRPDLGIDYYEMVDLDGDPHVQFLPNPVPPEIVVLLFRRFGELHGFLVTDLRGRKKH